jgi:hypothetical protein
MKLKSWLIVCIVLLSAVALAAQSGGTAADPISGIWKGEMNLSESQHSLTLTLKLDSQGVISGTVTGPPRPGEIKTGTFNPKTGALKLEVETKRNDGTVAQVVFEGTVVKGTATGRVSSSSNRSGDFKITKSASSK